MSRAKADVVIASAGQSVRFVFIIFIDCFPYLSGVYQMGEV